MISDEQFRGQFFYPHYLIFKRHSDRLDIVDFEWTKNSQLLMVATLDKQLNLYSLSTGTIVKQIMHQEITSCVAFHPVEDEIFATGSLDKILRIWDLLEGRVIDWIQTDDYITACAFDNTGETLVVGFYHGLFRIYKSEGKFKFLTEVTCRNSNIKEIHGKRVINIQFINEDEFMVGSSDSRIRLFNKKGYQLLQKYKGHTNTKYPLRANFSDYMVCPSESGRVCFWPKNIAKQSAWTKIFKPKNKRRNQCIEYFRPFSKPEKCTVA